MVICKFYQQGKCKFGDRCRNEHVRSHGQQDYHQGRSNNYGDNRNNQRGYYDSNKGQRYQGDNRSPFTRESTGHQGGFSSPVTEGRHQNQQQHFQHNNRNRYHWKKEESNRFSALSDAPPSGQAEDEAILKQIRDDMMQWGESKMWPYSSYSCAREKKSIEGLPDIQPEELRVLYLLHGVITYKNIVREMDVMYSTRKDELYSMTDSVKQAVLSEVNNSLQDSNPSSCLSIGDMYGRGVEFKSSQEKTPEQEKPVTGSLSLHPTPPEPQNRSLTLPTTPAPSFNVSPIKQEPLGGVKATMFKNSGFDSTSQLTEATTYTDRNVLTENEIKQFEAERFTLGEVPTRPPPRELCV